MRRILLTFVVTAAVLSGCAPDAAPLGRQWSQPERPPRFATAEDALAAAEEVYREYLEVSNDARISGDLSALRPLVTDSWWVEEQRSRESLKERDQRLVGQPTVTGLRLQDHDQHRVVIYACHDLESIRLLDADGRDVTPNTRAARVTMSIELVVENDELLVNGSEVWSTSC